MVNTQKDYNTKIAADANLDPISGEPGAHPIGTGIGTTGGAIAGAAIGTAAGPIGTIAGAVIGTVLGGIAGGYAGKGLAELVNPTEIDTYWKENYSSRPYANEAYDYESYSPAYRYGYEARAKNPEARFEDIENNLSTNWNSARGKSELDWANAKDAVRDSYDYTDEVYRARLNNKKN